MRCKDNAFKIIRIEIMSDESLKQIIKSLISIPDNKD